MSENIKTLLSESTTQEEKINAANNIIINYNLNLMTEEILSVFSKARLEINCPYYYSHDYASYEFLFEFLLNQNINMFIAMTKCCEHYEKTKTYWMLSWFISSGGNLYIGCNHLYSNDTIINTYKNFLDYNNFDIDNLAMTNECKKEIEEYRSEKYSGNLTKAAKK